MGGNEVTIEGISAITVFTADMATAVRFYELLGFRRRYGGPQAAFTSFHAGAGYINVMTGDPPACLWGRVIVYVSDVDAMYRRVREAGLSVESEPADAPWGERYFHVRDPDGNELSFARPVSEGVSQPADPPLRC